MIAKILMAPIRALRAASLCLVGIGLSVRFDFGQGRSFSAGIYRPGSDFSLGVDITLLENMEGPFSNVALNLGWLSVEVNASYGYGKDA